jgi:hypothetical protein
MAYLKPELSERSKYWIPKHRYYELKHYCLQYPHWKKLYSSLEFKMEVNESGIRSSEPGKPTEKYALIRASCKNAMELVEKCCREAAPELWRWLFKAVTQGVTFVQLQCKDEIPCGKDIYYDGYRRLFYILSQRRGI